MNPNERNEMIEEYGRGFDILTAALAEIPREAWQFKPAPHEWSIHELIVHMGDSEILGAMRLRKIIAEPGSNVTGYEEAVWAEALDYQSQDVDDALLIFKLARQTSYRLLKTLTDQIYTHSVVNPEYGVTVTLEDWLRSYTDHVPEHLRQLMETHQAWKHRPANA